MPGDGFTQWKYKDIAQHFYKKYHYKTSNDYDMALYNVIKHVIDIVEKEHQQARLDTLNIWSWTTLQSGKQWPLSKWVQVNTAAPLKRVSRLIKNLSLN